MNELKNLENELQKQNERLKEQQRLLTKLQNIVRSNGLDLNGLKDQAQTICKK